MRRILRLWWVDMRQNRRDPISLFSLFAPIYIAGVIRYLLPVVTVFAEPYFDLMEYFPAIVGVVIMFPGMLSGMFSGFLMLDERDEGTYQALQVTPLSGVHYALYRLLSPVIVGLIMALVMVFLMGTGSISPFILVLAAAVAALGGPLWAYSMYVLAENKIEGLAILKFLSLLIVIPLVSLFIPARWLPVLWPLPFYWPFRMIVSSTTGAGTLDLGLMWLAGIVVHFVYLLVLHRKLIHRE